MLTKIEPVKLTKADIEAKEMKNRKRMATKDIQEIEDALKGQETDVLIRVHKRMDGKYQSAISDWGKSMYGYYSELGFSYDVISVDSIVENLEMMKAKIEAFGEGINAKTLKGYDRSINIDVLAHSESAIHNEIKMEAIFQNLKEQIHDLTALSKDQVAEINEKLDILESILLSEEKKRTKWEKAQPIFKYIIDKGLDVAKLILPLIKEF